MTVNELILIESGKVRSSPDLMAFYIESFKSVFNYRPACAGCTFSSDWKKFVAKVGGSGSTPTIQRKTIMIDFKLKKVQHKILAYKANGKMHKLYDSKLTSDFVEAYLTNGTKEQIKDRKELFAILPEKHQPKIKAENIKKIEVVAPEIVSEAKPESKENKKQTLKDNKAKAEK